VEEPNKDIASATETVAAAFPGNRNFVPNSPVVHSAPVDPPKVPIIPCFSLPE